MKRTRTIATAAALSVGVIGGSVAVAALNPLAAATAQSSEGDQAASGPRARPEGPGPLAEALDELVADGTITQAQADAVRQRLEAKAEAHVGERPGPGGGGPGLALGRGEVAEAVAGALGTSPEDLRAQLEQGKSVGQVADEAGVDRAVVAQAARDALAAGIDRGVADGKLTQERADELRGDLDERVADLLDRTPPVGGPEGPGGPGGPGRPGPRGQLKGEGQGSGS